MCAGVVRAAKIVAEEEEAEAGSGGEETGVEDGAADAQPGLPKRARAQDLAGE